MKYDPWPLGKIPIELRRPELSLVKEMGYSFTDARDVIDIFEKKVADYAGSKYAIACDCCSHGLFLCLKYLKAEGDIVIPKNTYLSVPMQIFHAKCNVVFEDNEWSGSYKLNPYPIWDGAMQWKRNMFKEDFYICSFQIKKRIPIGRGGMILTNDINAYKWLKKASYDGRDLNMPYDKDNVSINGWHYYMTPEDAARGIILMDKIKHNENDIGGYKNYPDISNYKFLDE